MPLSMPLETRPLPTEREPKTTSENNRQMKQIQHSTWTSTKHNHDSVSNMSTGCLPEARVWSQIRASAGLVLQPELRKVGACGAEQK
jgi:hypothetical protein